MHGDEGYVG